MTTSSPATPFWETLFVNTLDTEAHAPILPDNSSHPPEPPVSEQMSPLLLDTAAPAPVQSELGVSGQESSRSLDTVAHAPILGRTARTSAYINGYDDAITRYSPLLPLHFSMIWSAGDYA